MQPRSSFVWNRPPGALTFYPGYSPHLLDYPFYDPIRVSQLSGRSYTVVIACNKPALRGSSPLIKLIRNIASAPHLSKVGMYGSWSEWTDIVKSCSSTSLLSFPSLPLLSFSPSFTLLSLFSLLPIPPSLLFPPFLCLSLTPSPPPLLPLLPLLSLT